MGVHFLEWLSHVVDIIYHCAQVGHTCLPLLCLQCMLVHRPLLYKTVATLYHGCICNVTVGTFL